MSDLYKMAKGVFEKELEKVLEKGDMSPTTLEYSYKLVDIIKDIGEICERDNAMYDEEYSGRRGYGMMRSRYYPRYEQGFIPEAMGYSEYGGYSNYGGNYSGNSNYGRGRSNNSSMKAELQRLLGEATNEHEKMMVQRWIDELG